MPRCYARRMASSRRQSRVHVGPKRLSVAALVTFAALSGCTILDRLENGKEKDNPMSDASAIDSSSPEASTDAHDDDRSPDAAESDAGPDAADASNASDATDANDASDASDANDSSG